MLGLLLVTRRPGANSSKRRAVVLSRDAAHPRELLSRCSIGLSSLPGLVECLGCTYVTEGAQTSSERHGAVVV